MTPLSPTIAFTHTAGDEIVVRLDGVEIFDLDHESVVPPPWVPGWTIARILSCVPCSRIASYLVSTELCESTCVCIIDETMIDGLA